MRTDYDQDMLNQINSSVDLFQYASSQMQFIKNGNDYFTHCPLHPDKTPSLSISPERNQYYCFSCGRGGSVIGFLMEYEGLRFEEAVEKAAKLAHVDLSKMCMSETIRYLKRIKSWASGKKRPFEHAILSECEYDRYSRGLIPEWLEEGISQETLDHFDIRTDDSANRIVYPVRDIDGRLINVKGRTRYKNYKDLRIPKYINYFQVGVMDYFQSLDMAKPHIKDTGEIIIFESIKSTMKAYDWGIRNCVSAEKHSLTNEQIALLVGLRCNIVLAYDSDINYQQNDVKQDVDKLKRYTNVYTIADPDRLLGGSDAKNSPADCGREVWEELYAHKRKVV